MYFEDNFYWVNNVTIINIVSYCSFVCYVIPWKIENWILDQINLPGNELALPNLVLKWKLDEDENK